MTTMTVEKLHPGIVALDERIRRSRLHLLTLESKSLPTMEDELNLIAQIEDLQNRLASLRRQREERAPMVTAAREKLAELAALRQRAIDDERIATAVWMTLLQQRNSV